MTLVLLLYLGGALLDGVRRLVGVVLRTATWIAGLALALLVLDGCSPEGWATADRVLALGVFGLAFVAFVARAVSWLCKAP